MRERSRWGRPRKFKDRMGVSEEEKRNAGSYDSAVGLGAQLSLAVSCISYYTSYLDSVSAHH